MKFATSLLAAALLSASATAFASDHAAAREQAAAPTVVLVHGAFADGSSWKKVIPLLEAKGIKAIAVQNPLTSLQDDVDAAKRVIDAQAGPVVLVGHSWGGTVITQAGNNDKVKALVYVAAFAPSAGESTSDVGKGYPPPPGLAHPVASPDGFLTLTPETVAQHFAQDLDAKETNLIAVSQGPVRGANFDEKIEKAAWASKPSWYIVAAQDHMIQPDAQRAMAKTIKAKTTELPTSHVPMLSRPKDVADVIEAAAKAIQ